MITRRALYSAGNALTIEPDLSGRSPAGRTMPISGFRYNGEFYRRIER